MSEIINEIDNLIDDLYKLRQSGLLENGEYSLKNLAFKEFRNLGYLQELKDMKVKEQNKEMSLESLNEGVVDDFISKTKSILDKNGIKYEDVYPDELGLEAGYGVTVNFGISGDYEAKQAIKVLKRELNSGDCYELVTDPEGDSDTELNIYADAFGYVNESLKEDYDDMPYSYDGFIDDDDLEDVRDMIYDDIGINVEVDFDEAADAPTLVFEPDDKDPDTIDELSEWCHDNLESALNYNYICTAMYSDPDYVKVEIKADIDESCNKVTIAQFVKHDGIWYRSEDTYQRHINYLNSLDKITKFYPMKDEFYLRFFLQNSL